jgi:hypothetical protein
MAKRALLIGVNRYRIPGADLAGCANDVAHVAAVLKKVCGFNPRNIRTLLDEQATTNAIRAGIETLVASAKPADVLLLYFAGRGSNLPDRTGDEAEFRDNILCPSDLDWRDPISESWLDDRWAKMRCGAQGTVILDCGFSGTATRAVSSLDTPVKERFLPSPWDLIAVESGRRLTGRRYAHALHAASEQDHPRCVVMMAGGPGTALEAEFSSQRQGVFTHHLVRSLSQSGGQLSYIELVASLESGIRANGYAQRPSLEGPAEFLDAPFLEPLAAVAKVGS